RLLLLPQDRAVHARLGHLLRRLDAGPLRVRGRLRPRLFLSYGARQLPGRRRLRQGRHLQLRSPGEALELFDLLAGALSGDRKSPLRCSRGMTKPRPLFALALCGLAAGCDPILLGSTEVPTVTPAAGDFQRLGLSHEADATVTHGATRRV